MSGDKFKVWHSVSNGDLLLTKFLNPGKSFLESIKTFANGTFT